MSLADEIERRVEERAIQTLELIGADLTGAAGQDAPIEEGTLRGSGSWHIEQTATGAQVVVTFSTPYAARQHEELEYRHPRGGKARYLGDQVKARVPRYVQGFRNAMADAVRGL